MARRTGLRTIRELTYRLCRLIITWQPTIERIYGNSHPGLIIALATVSAACEQLVAEADDALPTGV